MNFFLRNVTGVPEAYRQKATTMNLLSTIEQSSEISDVSTRNMVTPRNFNSMNLFPQQAGLGSSIPKEVVPKKTDSRCIMIVHSVQDKVNFVSFDLLCVSLDRPDVIVYGFLIFIL